MHFGELEMTKRFVKPVLVASTALALLYPSSLNAAGFYIQEQSASGLGTAFAGSAAKARDASIIYYNAAGMTELPGTNVNVAVNFIQPYSDLTDTGSTLFGGPIAGVDSDDPVGLEAIPNLYISQQLTDRFWVGLGVSFPFGLGSEYSEDWFGRYDSIKTELVTTNIQPTAAFKVNDWLSIGGGLDIQHADVGLTAAVNDGTEGLRTLEGDAITMGYNAGITLKPAPDTTVGISYRSSLFHEINGRLRVEGTAGSDVDINASAQLATPDIAGFGISHDLDKRWTLLAQANWFGWNNFEAITVRNSAGGIISNTIQNYQNTWSYSVGAEYILNDDWTLRAGYQYDATPTTDEYRTTLTPDGDRNWFTAGGTYNLNDQWSIDFSGGYIDIAEEEINLTRNSGNALVSADLNNSVLLFSAGLNYKF